MATTYEQFLREVSPHSGGAPEPLVVNAIRNAAIDFCKRSWCWVYNTTPVGITADTQDYTPTVPSGSKVAQVLYVTYNGKPVEATTRDEEIRSNPDWRNTTGTTPKRYIVNDDGESVALLPIPSATVAAGSTGIVHDGLHFTVALKPTRASEDVPDWLYENYAEDIAKGALARLYAMPKKLWTNANLAAVNHSLFKDAAAMVRSRVSRSFTRAPLRNYRTGVASW